MFLICLFTLLYKSRIFHKIYKFLNKLWWNSNFKISCILLNFNTLKNYFSKKIKVFIKKIICIWGFSFWTMYLYKNKLNIVLAWINYFNFFDKYSYSTVILIFSNKHKKTLKIKMRVSKAKMLFNPLFNSLKTLKNLIVFGLINKLIQHKNWIKIKSKIIIYNRYNKTIN